VIEDVIPWRFTGIYGQPSWGNKHITWDALRSLHGQMNFPWLAMGDFNEILFNYEKEGGRPRSQQAMQGFHDALRHCDLEDMGYVGELFTWRRVKIRERLDRGVVNEQWNDLFPFAKLVNSETTRSDHRPLLVDTEYLSKSHAMTDN
jgi:endonuclease/exonuclease/phosphatase family metal-dependent hydrolase